MRKLLRKPSPALIVATVALFFALGGGGVAALASSPSSTRAYGRSVVRAPHRTGTSIARCPSGYVATGGGYELSVPSPVEYDGPAGGGAWRVTFTNAAHNWNLLQAFAVCRN